MNFLPTYSARQTNSIHSNYYFFLSTVALLSAGMVLFSVRDALSFLFTVHPLMTELPKCTAQLGGYKVHFNLVIMFVNAYFLIRYMDKIDLTQNKLIWQMKGID